MRDHLANVFFRFWYKVICKIDKKNEVTFMNYGFHKENHDIKLEEKDLINMYSAKLYDYVATSVDIKDKNILEVGCGRGGGISYVNRYLKPKLATGIDLNDKAIEFCKKNYADQNIKFEVGNAEHLQFEDNCFDAVINVESSHRYVQFNKFLSEAYRVLKPGGHLLLADFRFDYQVEKLTTQMQESEFEVLKYEIITPNVLKALVKSSADTERLIKNMAPRFLHGIAKQFAATEGSHTFRKFSAREYEYVLYVLKKN